jgi:hypothetical protein
MAKVQLRRPSYLCVGAFGEGRASGATGYLEYDKGVVRVRRILSVLLEALGRPIGHGCWVDPMMRGSRDALGGEEVECLPKHRGSAQLGTTVVGKDGVSAPRHSRAGFIGCLLA